MRNSLGVSFELTNLSPVSSKYVAYCAESGKTPQNTGSRQDLHFMLSLIIVRLNAVLFYFEIGVTRLKRPLKKNTKKTLFSITIIALMHVKSIAELLTLFKLPFVIKIFVMSIFELPLFTSFTVQHQQAMFNCDVGPINGSFGLQFVNLFTGKARNSGCCYNTIQYA